MRSPKIKANAPTATAVQTREDPKITALRNSEIRQAEQDRIRALQDQLSTETRFRGNRFGFRSFAGSMTSGASRIRSLLGAG